MKENCGGKDPAKKFWYLIIPARFLVISEGGILSEDVMVFCQIFKILNEITVAVCELLTQLLGI